MGGTGTILSPGAPTVMVNNIPISVVGDLVSPHGDPPHTAPTIVTGSPTVFAQNRPVTVVGLSVATCAHLPNTGSPTVFTNN